MGFEDVLRNRLGPLKDLVARRAQAPAPAVDPARLFYRRAAGVEVRIRPDETWAQVMAGVPPHLKARPTDATLRLLGLTEWTAPGPSWDAKSLWKGVQDELLVYARFDPGRPLTGRAGALDGPGPHVARRAAVWPTTAVETAVEIAPMPFMPRGRDLDGATSVGVRLSSLERGHEVLGLTITGGEATGRRIRALLPLLDGRRSKTDILRAFAGRERHRAEKLLRLLDGLGLLEARAGAPTPAERLAPPRPAQVTWLGHAAVLLQSPRTSVLVDPLFFAPSDPPAPMDDEPRFDPRALPAVDAVLITHGDNDHLNPNSLSLIDPSTPVLIPAGPRYPAGFQVDMKGVLRVLGFRNVVEMPVGTRHRVGDLEVSAWPFEGEDWGLDLAQVTYLVEGPDHSVYFAADARRMDAVMQAIGQRDRPVDLAFMGVSGNAEPHVTPPELGYGNFYADWIPPARHHEWVQHCAGPADAVEALRRLGARFAFGYAAGGARYIQTAYSDWGDHETFARLLVEAALPCRPVDLPLGRPVALAELGGCARRTR